jgi:phosphoenolpyruvate synthase/pyruvate phosphate dikinase
VSESLQKPDESPTPLGAVAPPLPIDAPEVLEWLRPLEDIAHGTQGRRSSAKRVGGKAAMLGKLAREGFPVPRGWLIEARHFEKLVEKALPRGHDVGSLIKLAGSKDGIDRAARARDRILSQPLPEGLVAAIESLWRHVEHDAPWGVAARSSATCEDREDTSFAGLATSILGARGPVEIAAAIRRVWASAFLPRALAYLAHAGVREIGMAVVIQQMVRAEAAGVLFSEASSRCSWVRRAASPGRR